jgi:septal ring factor EnvC (AmiA/AmiB activator)
MVGILLIAMQALAIQPEETKRKQQELKSLRTEINKLKVEINKTEANKSQAMGALQQSDSAISEANRMLNDLQKRQIGSQVQLDKVKADMAKVKAHIANSQKQIAEILKARYQHGHYEAWRLLLNQQSPNAIHRDLQYYSYIAKAQQDLAKELKSQLLTLDRLAEEIRQRQVSLKDIYTQKQQQRIVLETEKKRKAAALVSLSKEVNDKKTRLQRMQTDEKNLTYLVNRLTRLIQEEARKRAQEDARKKAEWARFNAQKAGKQVMTQPSADKALSDQGKKMALETPTQPLPIADESRSGRIFSALKGRLRLPVAGAIVGRFGALREEGSTWKGVFIRANIGQSVKGIADGKVVFAEWLRGFGNMIIVDHGEGYMSLYGHNESLVKRIGDQVKAGESIATVGDSGGSQEAGVYFEIRQHGRPQNPLQWAPRA